MKMLVFGVQMCMTACFTGLERAKRLHSVDVTAFQFSFTQDVHMHTVHFLFLNNFLFKIFRKQYTAFWVTKPCHAVRKTFQ